MKGEVLDLLQEYSQPTCTVFNDRLEHSATSFRMAAFTGGSTPHVRTLAMPSHSMDTGEFAPFLVAVTSSSINDEIFVKLLLIVSSHVLHCTGDFPWISSEENPTAITIRGASRGSASEPHAKSSLHIRFSLCYRHRLAHCDLSRSFYILLAGEVSSGVRHDG